MLLVSLQEEAPGGRAVVPRFGSRPRASADPAEAVEAAGDCSDCEQKQGVIQRHACHCEHRLFLQPARVLLQLRPATKLETEH